MTAIAAATAPRPDARHIVSALLGSLAQASRPTQANHSTRSDFGNNDAAAAIAATQLDRARDEHVRWIVLRALEAGGQFGARDRIVLSVVHAMYPHATLASIHAALAFLAGLKLATVEHGDIGRRACLTAAGVAVVNHSADVPAGIARPSKVWA